MTYRKLLAAVGRAKELEQALFWARDRESTVHSRFAESSDADCRRATAATDAALRALDGEIDFNV
jgi:hypothetical protein